MGAVERAASFFLCRPSSLFARFFLASLSTPMASSILLASAQPLPCCSSGRAVVAAAPSTATTTTTTRALLSGRRHRSVRARRTASSVVAASAADDASSSSPSSSYLRPATQGIKRDASELFGDTPMVGASFFERGERERDCKSRLSEFFFSTSTSTSPFLLLPTHC